MSMGFRVSTSPRLRRPLVAALILALATLFTAASTVDGFARLGGGGSFGNRGSRTYSAPPSTYTAPRPSAIAPNPGFNSGYAQQRPGFFSGGFGRGLLGGLVGAGLVGMLFGGGFGGGLGGFSSILGLVLQLGLLYLAFRFIMGLFRNRQAFSGAAAGQAPAAGNAAAFGGGGGSGNSQGAPRGTPITITPDDFTRFEQRLGEIQAVYSAEDLNGLRRLSTPEMADHFAAELSGNQRQGVVNRLSDVRLLQGDLAEAWREGATDYATVAMRFSLLDATVERASGRVVAGSSTAPQTVTELWTFVRSSGTGLDNWVLSAIQQA